MTVVNQRKMLEKILEFHDCEHENFSIICDLGGQIIAQSDSQ